MGYDSEVVGRLLEENDISDVQEAIDMYEGHRFVASKDSRHQGICYIC
jgi:hypothetical protein